MILLDRRKKYHLQYSIPKWWAPCWGIPAFSPIPWNTDSPEAIMHARVLAWIMAGPPLLLSPFSSSSLSRGWPCRHLVFSSTWMVFLCLGATWMICRRSFSLLFRLVGIAYTIPGAGCKMPIIPCTGCKKVYYSGWLQKILIFWVVAKKTTIPGGCKKTYYSGWLQKMPTIPGGCKKAYYSGWLQKKPTILGARKKSTIPGNCK